ncbi:hypothetical protein [Listeria monocytogenes]
MENGRNEPDMETIVKLANILKFQLIIC